MSHLKFRTCERHMHAIPASTRGVMLHICIPGAPSSAMTLARLLSYFFITRQNLLFLSVAPLYWQVWRHSSETVNTTAASRCRVCRTAGGASPRSISLTATCRRRVAAKVWEYNVLTVKLLHICRSGTSCLTSELLDLQVAVCQTVQALLKYRLWYSALLLNRARIASRSQCDDTPVQHTSARP